LMRWICARQRLRYGTPSNLGALEFDATNDEVLLSMQQLQRAPRRELDRRRDLQARRQASRSERRRPSRARFWRRAAEIARPLERRASSYGAVRAAVRGRAARCGALRASLLPECVGDASSRFSVRSASLPRRSSTRSTLRPSPEGLPQTLRHGEPCQQRRVSAVVDAASGLPRCAKQFIWLRTILQPNSALALALTNSLASGFSRSWVVICQEERGKQGKNVEVIFGHIYVCAKVSVRRRY
jgi:hypothetical protein